MALVLLCIAKLNIGKTNIRIVNFIFWNFLGTLRQFHKSTKQVYLWQGDLTKENTQQWGLGRELILQFHLWSGREPRPKNTGSITAAARRGQRSHRPTLHWTHPATYKDPNQMHCTHTPENKECSSHANWIQGGEGWLQRSLRNGLKKKHLPTLTKEASMLVVTSLAEKI